MKKIAICQPYFAPHLAYFQLINAVDVFVSYDNVNFITRGWINRNKIIVNKKEWLFSIPLKSQSQHKKINEIEIDWSNRLIDKTIKTMKQAYSRSKNKHSVSEVVDKIFNQKPALISELSFLSIKEFCNYLEIDTQLKIASHEKYSRVEDKTENLINICKLENANHYINPIGGIDLYDKSDFMKRQIDLSFMNGICGLSIIDVCMNNSKEEIKKQLEDYSLV